MPWKRPDDAEAAAAISAPGAEPSDRPSSTSGRCSSSRRNPTPASFTSHFLPPIITSQPDVVLIFRIIVIPVYNLTPTDRFYYVLAYSIKPLPVPERYFTLLSCFHLFLDKIKDSQESVKNRPIRYCNIWRSTMATTMDQPWLSDVIKNQPVPGVCLNECNNAMIREADDDRR